jgi:type I restriction enzyme S subunit
MSWPSYSRYKPSGVEWLGEVPEHWGTKRGRFCMDVNPPSHRLRTLLADDEVSFVPMEAVGEYGVLKLEQTRNICEVGSGYTEFDEGDVVVAKITPCFENGKGALAAGLLNGAAFGTTELLVLRSASNLQRRFLFYYTISSFFRSMGEGEMYGAGGQKRVPPEFCKNVPIPLPLISEQSAIADFLDRETAKIDTLVAKKRTLIERLKEKRAALISRTVTRGLPPDAARAAGLEPHPRLKPSGIDWLGDVPDHWKVSQLKWAVMFQRGHDLPADDREAGRVPLVSSSGVSATHSMAIAEAPGIVTGRYGTIGQFYLVEEDYWPLNTTLYSIHLHGNEPRFLQALLTHLAPLFLLNAVKSAVPGVDRNDIHPVRTVVPPKPEQESIAAFLNRETVKINGLVAKVETAIDRLLEYRTALITAAVTGKIDVRHQDSPKGALHASAALS